VKIDLDLAGTRAEDARLSPDLEATIYRLVQEAMNNALKHADPKRISITLIDNGDRVHVEVSDDGSGFDAKAVERSFGLVGMEERVTLAGGRLQIESAPGAGTRVIAELPIGKDGEAVPAARRFTPGESARSPRG
jgi:two-component system sensor histidine kinase DegS